MTDEEASGPVENESEPAPNPDVPASYPTDDDDEFELPAGADGGTTRLLARLLRVSPFLALDERAGGHHPRRRMICFTFDFLLRGLIYLILLAIIVAVAWKTLAPLPELQVPELPADSN